MCYDKLRLVKQPSALKYAVLYLDVCKLGIEKQNCTGVK